MRDWLWSKGVPVVGPMDHGFCVSIYFAGPENLSLELSYSEAAINPEARIDPEVQAHAGISGEELVRYKQFGAYADKSGGVAQPLASAPGPHMTNCLGVAYETSIVVPAEVIRANSENEPPLTIEGC
ncbi:MAG: hypothetical protein P8P91_03980 [Pseudomonadales bacterium]|nr:hypothetical protein [Pseudomonadales bacterium]